MAKISELAQQIKELSEPLVKEVQSNGNTGQNQATSK